MWKENKVFAEDLAYADQCLFVPWDELDGKTVLITGGTGLIGSTLAKILLFHGGIHVMLLVRNLAKAQTLYADVIEDGHILEFIEGSVEELPEIPEPVDYIVHGAAPTTSSYFVDHPVETIRSIVNGTEAMLELALEKQVLGVAVLSSMEVFGEIHDESPLDETAVGYLDPVKLRSSYPEAKRLMETLCSAYASEYGIPVTAIRLAQTFGPGVSKSDRRVFAYLASCAMDGKDIRLNTSGAKKNPYLYTMDAVTAILLLMCKGARGEVYTAANPETYCTVKEMAEMVARTLGRGKIGVFTNCGSSKNYPPEGFLNLDVTKLQQLGWSPRYDLPEMYRRLASGWI